ncbi:hemerythrin domain-containing protein [Maribellus maritimus]|uniref:hemerythrin domain-containing protein n=1 Tax=Maribellus maritimus TaxID=2870838 RepID=UPI001EEC67F9|nr:hemerythrin domain-containing protein [Maribellus maritimus]MCG6189244.1 hemerythrin domain-containing protein [Maribellus maritimus]
MVTLIRTNYHLLPVINRFGIRLGFKDKTIEEVCELHKISSDFFLAIVNTFHNEDYFPEEELLSFSPHLIVQYLKRTHQYYINYILPKMESLLEQLNSDCSPNCKELKIIDAFYKRYKNELLNHINDEETRVFPYVVELINNPRSMDPNFTITEFEKEHSNVEIQLEDLKNLIIKYIEPVYDENICNEFLITLFRFEADIKDHARIEDAILVPLAIAIEDKYRG